MNKTTSNNVPGMRLSAALGIKYRFTVKKSANSTTGFRNLALT